MRNSVICSLAGSENGMPAMRRYYPTIWRSERGVPRFLTSFEHLPHAWPSPEPDA